MGTTTTTLPIPQPDAQYYPVSDLDIFVNLAANVATTPSITARAACLALTGKQAPPANASMPEQDWFDPAPAGAPYLIFNDGVAQEVPIPPAIAGVPNLPGAYDFPPYASVAVPSLAVWVPWLTEVSPDDICTQEAAQALANTLAPLYKGCTLTVVDNTSNGASWSINYAPAEAVGDMRRMYGISITGAIALMLDYAQNLIRAASYQYGVGSPGSWSLPTSGPPVPVWTSMPQNTACAPGPATPVPIRALLPNEQFQVVPPSNPLFGKAGWMVVRTDLSPTITLEMVQQDLAAYNAQPGVAQYQLVPATPPASGTVSVT